MSAATRYEALLTPAAGQVIKISELFYTRIFMANEDLQAELERLRAENQALKKTSSRGLSLRVSEKGGLSVYGLGRFPVTLYKEQWVKLLDMADDIRAFLKANEGQLKSKETASTGDRE